MTTSWRRNLLTGLGALLLATGWQALAVPTARAEEGSIIYVDSTATGVVNDGTSWANAYTSLKLALEAAVSGDQIWVAAGTYTPTSNGSRAASFILNAGVKVYGGFAGTETTLAQRPMPLAGTILSGDLNGDDVGFTNSGDNSFWVVTSNGDGTLDGLTITGGSSIWTDPKKDGGGLIITGDTTVSDVIISGNSGLNGAGVRVMDGSPSFNRVVISGNRSYWNGGGMYIATRADTPTLTDVLITGNTASTLQGGAIYVEAPSAPTLTHVTIAANTANDMPGISSDAPVQIRNSIVWDDDVLGGTGSYVVTNSLVKTGGGAYPGTDNVTGDPLFLDADHGDFRLGPGSRAIDAGSDSTWTVGDIDLEGRPRKSGAHVDIGAYEVPTVTVTAGSPTSVQAGTAAPAVSYTTDPATVPADWSTEPTCAIYASAEEADVTPLTGAVTAGSYVTRCSGGVLLYGVASYAAGTFVVEPAAVTPPPADSPQAVVTLTTPDTPVERGVNAHTGDADGMSPLVALGLLGLIAASAYAFVAHASGLPGGLRAAVLSALGWAVLTLLVRVADLLHDWLPSRAE